jgi:hypothetical protein
MTYMTSRPEIEPATQVTQATATQSVSATAPTSPAAAQMMGPPRTTEPAPAAQRALATITPAKAAKAAPQPDATIASGTRVRSSTSAMTTAPDPSRSAATVAARGPMPGAKEVIDEPPVGHHTLQIALNLVDHALWGNERWRDAAEPEKIARFLVDDIRILTLQMYAEDLGNGVARFGVRGNLTNSSLQERVVTLRIELVNGPEVSLSIPLEIEVDEQEEEEFDKELDMAAATIKASPATRLRLTLSSVPAD